MNDIMSLRELFKIDVALLTNFPMISEVEKPISAACLIGQKYYLILEANHECLYYHILKKYIIFYITSYS